MAESALEFLKQELDRLQQESADYQKDQEAQMALLRRSIERLSARDGQPFTAGSAPAKPIPVQPPKTGQRIYSISNFRGMDKPTALHIYMRARQAEGATKISFDELMRDLEAGELQALEAGDPEFRERSIMAIARQQPRLYGYDRIQRVIWMAPTAENPPIPEARSKPKEKTAKGKKGAGGVRVG